jgi:hypothetical protein
MIYQRNKPQQRKKIQTATSQLLDDLATHPDATIRFYASYIILHIHSDASYFSVSKASRLGGLFYLGYNFPNEDKLNGSILNVASIIKNVVASAAESEVGACFQNAQTAAPLRIDLMELGHKQLVTPLRTDNSTAFGILNETIKQKRSKSMEMKYYWLQDRVRQKQYDVYWRPGKDNLGYYYTKHHSAQRPIMLHQANSLNVLRGCVKLPYPQLCKPKDKQTFQRTLRSTQVRCALARAYTVILQNRPLRNLV